MPRRNAKVGTRHASRAAQRAAGKKPRRKDAEEARLHPHTTKQTKEN